MFWLMSEFCYEQKDAETTDFLRRGSRPCDLFTLVSEEVLLRYNDHFVGNTEFYI